MKKVILSLFVLLFTTVAFSQSAMYKGSTQLNFGVGLYNAGIPVYLGLDYSVLRDVTLGAEVSYRAYNENWHSSYYNHNIIGASVNANYHLNTLLGLSPRWDLYGGANLGFYLWTSPDGYTGNNSSGLGFGGQFGGRYYFTNSLGVNLEFGGGNAFTGGKIGLSIRL